MIRIPITLWCATWYDMVRWYLRRARRNLRNKCNSSSCHFERISTDERFKMVLRSFRVNEVGQIPTQTWLKVIVYAFVHTPHQRSNRRHTIDRSISVIGHGRALSVKRENLGRDKLIKHWLPIHTPTYLWIVACGVLGSLPYFERFALKSL